MKTFSFGRDPISRRRVLQGAAAMGAATIAPRFAAAQDTSVLRVRSYSDIQVLDPGFRLSQPEGDVMKCIYLNLAAYVQDGETWNWEPRAAKSLTALDDTHIAFELRQGLMYSDNYGEMSAEDVKYSYERIADPANESPYRDDWSSLDHVEVKDKYNGIIVLKEPFAPLWTSTLPTDSACILPKAAIDAVGGKITTAPPVYSGPYRLKKWEPKQRITLERNPNWTLERPDFDEIHILPIEDESAAERGFEAGELDFTWTSVGSIPRYLQTPPEGASFVRKPSLAYVWLGMNQDNEALKDERIRHAIQLAVDRKGVVDAAYLGAAETSTGIIAPGLIGHREKNLYDRNVEEAQKLLDEAGASGLTLTLAILNKTEALTAAQVVQANLAEVGITVEIEQHDSGTFWTLGSEADGTTWKDIQLIISRFTMQPDPSWATAWFTPQQIGVWNWERFNSPEFGELHAKALIELDTAKRNEMYIRMQDLMEQSGDYVFLTHEAVGCLYRSNVIPALRPDGVPYYPGFRRA
jgi:peptide/nickel transport system substrate-binding protein